MKTADLLIEIAAIYKGNRSDWKSDKIIQADGFLRRFARDNQQWALDIANDIVKNMNAASEVSGLHPARCESIANKLFSYANNSKGKSV